jgi:hypothetical protein
VLKDVLFIPGQNRDSAGNIVDNFAPIGMRSYPSGFFAAVKDPWIRRVHSIANLGSKNHGLNNERPARLVPSSQRIARRSQLQR